MRAEALARAPGPHDARELDEAQRTIARLRRESDDDEAPPPPPYVLRLGGGRKGEADSPRADGRLRVRPGRAPRFGVSITDCRASRARRWWGARIVPPAATALPQDGRRRPPHRHARPATAKTACVHLCKASMRIIRPRCRVQRSLWNGQVTRQARPAAALVVRRGGLERLDHNAQPSLARTEPPSASALVADRTRARKGRAVSQEKQAESVRGVAKGKSHQHRFNRLSRPS